MEIKIHESLMLICGGIAMMLVCLATVAPASEVPRNYGHIGLRLLPHDAEQAKPDGWLASVGEYPEWHIARLEGSDRATEGFDASSVGPRTQPDHEWRHDLNPVGSHDFASTKPNIHSASLVDPSG